MLVLLRYSRDPEGLTLSTVTDAVLTVRGGGYLFSSVPLVPQLLSRIPIPGLRQYKPVTAFPPSFRSIVYLGRFVSSLDSGPFAIFTVPLINLI